MAASRTPAGGGRPGGGGGRPGPAAGAAGSEPGGAGTALVCAIDVSHVYGGSARLTSSMMCGQVNRLSSMVLIIDS